MVLLALDGPTPIAPTGAVATAIGWMAIVVLWVGAVTVGVMIGHAATVRGAGAEANEVRRARAVLASVAAFLLVVGIVVFNLLLPLPIPVAVVMLVGAGIVAGVGAYVAWPGPQKSRNR